MRAATYNVWNNENGDRRERFLQLRDEIRRLDADVIGLQEVTPQFFEEVLENLGYAHCLYCQYPQEEEGLAILSRYPIMESKTLYEDEKYEHSLAVHAVLQVKHLRLSFTNVHLPWNSVLNREKQIVAIDRYIHEQHADFSILLGDFNAGMNSSVNGYLQGDQTLNGCEASPCWNELASAYAARMNRHVEPTLDPIRNPRWAGKNAPFAPMVTDRIYVMESWDSVELKSAGIFGTEVSGENQLAPSDHYGVLQR